MAFSVDDPRPNQKRDSSPPTSEQKARYPLCSLRLDLFQIDMGKQLHPIAPVLRSLWHTDPAAAWMDCICALVLAPRGHALENRSAGLAEAPAHSHASKSSSPRAIRASSHGPPHRTGTVQPSVPLQKREKNLRPFRRT